MFWQLRTMDSVDEMPAPCGRFAMHRAGDGEIDLRIEMDGYLMGWRVANDALADDAWATEKAPHPVDWIDTAAGRIDSGTYAWTDRDDNRRALILKGEQGTHAIAFERVTSISTREAHAISDALANVDADATDAPALIADGATARRRAIARFTGLGRELDGDSFDSAVWTRALESMSLEEIHRQLETLESRFDAKYPPMRTSVAEAIEVDADARESAMAILQG